MMFNINRNIVIHPLIKSYIPIMSDSQSPESMESTHVSTMAICFFVVDHSCTFCRIRVVLATNIRRRG